jgi:hypothetical protein
VLGAVAQFLGTANLVKSLVAIFFRNRFSGD